MTTTPTTRERKASYERLFVAAFRLGFSQARPNQHRLEVAERRAKLLYEAIEWYQIRKRCRPDPFASTHLINRGTRGRFLTLAADFSRACIDKDKDKARQMAQEMYKAADQLHSEAKGRRKLRRRRRKEAERRMARRNTEAVSATGAVRTTPGSH